MLKTIVENKEQWDEIIFEVGADVKGLGITDYKGNYYYGMYTPEKYPFILIRGDFVSGFDFDHEQMMIIYPEDFTRVWVEF